MEETATAARKSVMVDRLVFALNGHRYEVASADVDPSMPLLEFIRTRTPFKGTKLGCGEGPTRQPPHSLFLSLSLSSPPESLSSPTCQLPHVPPSSLALGPPPSSFTPAPPRPTSLLLPRCAARDASLLLPRASAASLSLVPAPLGPASLLLPRAPPGPPPSFSPRRELRRPPPPSSGGIQRWPLSLRRDPMWVPLSPAGSGADLSPSGRIWHGPHAIVHPCPSSRASAGVEEEQRRRDGGRRHGPTPY
ncbi:hypothetical protein PR202_ga30539 [Eleusine coracana subsp. coracana]|uniref:Uncharacterized protein n=1 Tax=Eleusine coracana subsp. coracana TaxID=191504 RepID=A0AAV5DPF9_ELECO|nr:hypothetical protein PR202_ga30505 [Eleusine coracana subsp. coracana]GJN12274.1 hypothetical protein PR202_ga30539 [Eleusine coracana subsp. coracana]